MIAMKKFLIFDKSDEHCKNLLLLLNDKIIMYNDSYVSRGIDRAPVLWWLSPGEGRDAITSCGWGKLLKGRNY